MTAVDPPAKEAPPPRGRRRRSRREGGGYLSRVEKGLAIAAALIGTLAGAVGLIDWVRGLSPDPPAIIDARIEEVAQRNTRELLGDYLDRTRQSRRGYAAADLRQPGYVFNVSIQIVGQLGKKFPLRWSLYRQPEARVRGPSYNQVAGEIEPLGHVHARTWPVWVPHPLDAGTYIVRFTLEDDGRRPVSEEDSEPFEHRGAPAT